MHANQSQADLRLSLERLRIPHVPYYLVNSMDVNAGPFIRLWISLRPEVKEVYEIPVLRPLAVPIPISTGSVPAPTVPPWNIKNIGADRVWKEFGITGKGIVVGQSDSGVQWNHPELRATYRGFDSTLQLITHDYNWMDPWNKTIQPTDTIGHGTHTLGSIVGKTVGVAPGAKWFACLNQARNLGNPPRYLDCMQFMLAPYPLNGDPFKSGDPEKSAHVINNSWGCPNLEGCRPDSLLPAVRALRAAGIFVVASAGNDGSRCESLDYPIAIYGEVFSVGAVDSWGKLAEFSSRGPVVVDNSNRVKPDIVAPGVEVLSSFPGDTYAFLDGTSMAGPHVVGVVALMWSANPNLIGDINATEDILRETAKPYQYPIEGDGLCANGEETPNNAVGYGLVDAYAAVTRVLELKVKEP
jgi:subtilisin family serine protease